MNNNNASSLLSETKSVFIKASIKQSISQSKFTNDVLFLIDAYIAQKILDHESIMNVESMGNMIHLIYEYFNNYKIYAFVDKRCLSQIGIQGTDEHQMQMVPNHRLQIRELSHISTWICDPSQVSVGDERLIYKSINNQILFTAGQDIRGTLGIGSVSDANNANFHEQRELTPIVFAKKTENEEQELSEQKSSLMFEIVSSGISARHTVFTCIDDDHKQSFYGFGNPHSYGFGCGANADGKAKLPSSQMNTAEYLSVLSATFTALNVNITQIACGASHTLFLSSNGYVYGCGLNYNGQLGHSVSKCNRILIAVKIPLLSNVSHVQCGTYHNLLLSNDDLWVFGMNNHGQLGLSKEVNCVEHPMCHQYFADKHVIKISAGAYHSLCLCRQNIQKSKVECKVDDRIGYECYLFGNNRSQKVCDDMSVKKVFDPLLISNDECEWVDGNCGRFHTILMNEENMFRILGNVHVSNSEMNKFNEKRHFMSRIIAGFGCSLIFTIE